MPPTESFYPAESIEDTIEALGVEQGPDRPAMFWLTLLLVGGALAALPLARIDLSVRARGVVRLPADPSALAAGVDEASAGGPLLVEAFLRESDVKFLRIGQPAILQYDAYPYNEWGTAPGIVEAVSFAPVRIDQQALFKVVVRSPTRLLRMPDGRAGPIVDGMTVSARLIVNRKSLLQLITQKSEDLFGT
jgi:multidrug efflux pump subunit AcrA (membrane-fusion protein)